MSTFNEGEHPRANGGQFAAKPAAAESQVSLGMGLAGPDLDASRAALDEAGSRAADARRGQARAAMDLVQARFPAATTITTTTGAKQGIPTHITAVQDRQGRPLWNQVRDSGPAPADPDMDRCSDALAQSRVLDRLTPLREWSEPRRFAAPRSQNGVALSREMRRASYSIDSIG